MRAAISSRWLVQGSTKLGLVAALALATLPEGALSAPPGTYSFGENQTIPDISKLAWSPLQLQGLPPGIEIATLRGTWPKAEVRLCSGHHPTTSCQIIVTPVMRSMSG